MPVLLEGETSVGKTSLIRYLAQLVGQTCLRVNNHEHSDVQEYVGSYAASGADGRLAFREGVLVEAMRRGHWIILDELNLAPTDILEALNRVSAFRSLSDYSLITALLMKAKVVVIFCAELFF